MRINREKQEDGGRGMWSICEGGSANGKLPMLILRGDLRSSKSDNITERMNCMDGYHTKWAGGPFIPGYGRLGISTSRRIYWKRRTDGRTHWRKSVTIYYDRNKLGSQNCRCLCDTLMEFQVGGDREQNR